MGVDRSSIASLLSGVIMLGVTFCDSSVSYVRPDVSHIPDIVEPDTTVIDCQPEGPDTAVDLLTFTPCLAFKTRTECENQRDPYCEWFEMKKACTEDVVGFCDKNREYIQGPLARLFIRLVSETTCYEMRADRVPHSQAWTYCTYPFVWQGQCHAWHMRTCEDYWKHYPYQN